MAKRKLIQVQLRREGVLDQTVERPLEGDSVSVGGKWFKVQYEGETPFVEIGPKPPPPPPYRPDPKAVAALAMIQAVANWSDQYPSILPKIDR